jgi:polyhydroxyalkanoate synthesis regulator phasin
VPATPTEEDTVAPNEKSSKRVAHIASEVLKKGKATPEQAKTLAASVLTQAPDKPKKKPGK